jgi:hypothetical protein
MSLLDRYEHLWAPEPNTGCYLWSGTGQRYGNVKIDHKLYLIHRLICEEIYGSPPTSEHHALHDTPSGCTGGFCINPAHLRWGTRTENQLDILPEKRQERTQKMVAAILKRTPEQQSERTRKGWETRRSNR